MAPFRKITLLLVLALLAAGCGGGGDDEQDVPANAIAVVGEQEIPRAEFNRLITQAEKSFEAQEQDFPEAGTPEFENVKSSIVSSLVQRAQWEQEAAVMGIEVTDQEITRRLGQLKEQFFQGNQKKYEEELEKQGLTDVQVRDELSSRILSEKIFRAVTKDVKVTDKDIQAHYDRNRSQFEQPASREVRHILVKTKERAADIHAQLTAGATFAKLARQFSEDEGSKAQGGKLTAQKGRTVAPFDKFVFSAKVGQLSEPIKTEFGWHVIEILGEIKPKSATPIADVRESIRGQLLQQKQNGAMRRWVSSLRQKYADDTAYAPGFAPAAAAGGSGTGTAPQGG